MCVVSMVFDHYYDKWNPLRPFPGGINPDYLPKEVLPKEPAISDEEIREFRKLLDRARKYDKEHNQPDCELLEKQAKLTKLAEELGVKINFEKPTTEGE